MLKTVKTILKMLIVLTIFAPKEFVVYNIGCHLYVFQVWFDEYLTWDPRDHNGVAEIKLPNNWIWTPDIMLYNT